MKALLAVTLSALAAAGCTRTVVVERPVPVPAQTVVEKPVVIERPVIATAPMRACAYGGTPFVHGSTSCQASNEFRCADGLWMETGARC